MLPVPGSGTGGGGMLVVETIARIRREFFVKGRSIKEIVRDLKASRNTVRKVLRSAIPERAGLAGQHGHVVPGIEHGLIAAEGAKMIGDDAAVLTDLDSVRIGSDLDRPSDRAGADRVAVIVEPHEAGLRDRSRHRMEAIEAARIGHERRPLGLKGL